MRRFFQDSLLLLTLLCLGLDCGPVQSAEWKKHVVHTGVHTVNAVAADFTGDKKVDIIANSGGKTRLFVGPDWTETSIESDPAHSCIHSEFLDVDRDGDLDWVGARYQPGLGYWLECPKKPLKQAWKFHLVDDQVNGIHGLLKGDVDGDGRPDLLANSAQPVGRFPNSLAWLKVPRRPRKADRWHRHLSLINISEPTRPERV